MLAGIPDEMEWTKVKFGYNEHGREPGGSCIVKSFLFDQWHFSVYLRCLNKGCD